MDLEGEPIRVVGDAGGSPGPVVDVVDMSNDVEGLM